MGYYDEGGQTPQTPQTPSPQKSKGGRNAFWTGLIGVLTGALIAFLVLGGFSRDDTNTNSSTKTNETSNLPDKKVNLDIDTTTTEAAEEVGKSVVGVTNLQSRTFLGQAADADNETVAGTGSGVIYKIDGDKAYVVTNNHVVEGSTSLEVTLHDGKKVPAELVGADELMDLAVVTISSDGIKDYAKFGSSEDLKVGEPVIAIGNPLGLELSGSVTQGIVSGLDRAVPIYDESGNVIWNAEVIQTDAAINPGNSGGALVNMEGEVIGINSMKISQSAVEGIGFAIPIDVAKPIIESLEENGKVIRPYFGVAMVSLDSLTSYNLQEELKLPKDVTEGIVISEVSADSPADKAGIKKYDVITEMNGQKITDIISFKETLYKDLKPGDKVDVKYYRDGKEEKTTVELGKTQE